MTDSEKTELRLIQDLVEVVNKYRRLGVSRADLALALRMIADLLGEQVG